MKLNIYLTFNGNCQEAVEYYADVFGVELQEIMLYGDMPPDEGFVMPEEMKNRVMHTFLDINGNTLMLGDAMPDSSVTSGSNIDLTIVTDDLEEIERVFNRLKEDGEVKMDLQETFWTKSYGCVIDKFGIPWQFSHEETEPAL